jgi:protocatechuate 3,4-dioxygenase beta subunit
MENDDAQVGRILSRREVVVLLGAMGVGVVAGPGLDRRTAGAQQGRAVPACVVRPEQTEGPYFVDEKLNRADIRSNPSDGAVSQGVPLDLTVRVSRVSPGACTALAGAMVDVWQCDAGGIYSDVRDMNGFFDTRGKKFLRGYQVSDAQGVTRFSTIYPGWYQGRTTHIHFKVRTSAEAGRAYEFTSQLYFEDAVSDEIFARAPYASNTQRRVKNDGDGIFRRGGAQLLVPLERQGDGYRGVFDIGLQV